MRELRRKKKKKKLPRPLFDSSIFNNTCIMVVYFLSLFRVLSSLPNMNDENWKKHIFYPLNIFYLLTFYPPNQIEL